MDSSTVVGEIALPEGDPGAVEDAAVRLKGIGGGFDQLGGTIDRAAAPLSSWKGLASLEFNHACVTYRGAADQADTACTAAAAVLSGWARTHTKETAVLGEMHHRGAGSPTTVETVP
jgi:hypothetical protein